MRILSAALTVSLLLIQPIAAQNLDTAAPDAEDRIDAAWSRRAEGHNGSQAAPGPIAEVIATCEEALAREPGNLKIKARLLEAFWFQGEHVPLDANSRLAVFEKARDIAQKAIDALVADLPGAGSKSSAEEIAKHLRDTEHAAEIYFWGAAHWGLWGRHRGKIASARQGVAGKIRDYSEIVIALDERIEGAGGHRILGRLHAEAPRLPFVTGWIDRDEAVRQLRLAVELAPDKLLNRLYYLEALIEFDRSRRAQAILDLETFASREPRAATVVEDLKTLDEARELLQRVDN